MNSKVFWVSRQRAINALQQSMRELNLKVVGSEKLENRIYARKSWRLLSPPQEVEVTVFANRDSIELVTNVTSQFSVLDLGRAEWLEEELLFRVSEHLSQEKEPVSVGLESN